ncbi:MAG: PQQ-binding-like beta-propeller repeat protein [Bryobacterales bacterium]|nr:PQQ-binding-like beta-propeller repeat protein [Bryobacterales bacterium]
MGLLRAGVRLFGMLLKTVAAVIVIGVAAYFLLTRVGGMRVERAGTGFTPIFTFDDPEEHMEALERERAEQPAAPAVETEPAPEPVAEAVEPEPVALETQAPAQPAPREEAPQVLAAPWPEYRGAGRRGVIEGVKIRTDWPLEELWRTRVGGGYASMVIAEGKLFTIEQRRGQEVVAAYAVDNGHELWTHGWDAQFEESLGGPGPRATPTYANGRIYALGAEGELECLRAADGKLVWRTNILADAGSRNPQWAMSGAPLVLDGRVIVQPGGQGTSVAAYDAATGKILWQSGDDPAGYASPQAATLAGREQALIFSGSRLFAVDPSDGSELWEFPFAPSPAINVGQPIQVSDAKVWISSGYGRGAVLLEIRKSGDGFEVEKLWDKNTMKNKFNSSVLCQGHVYGLDDGIMAAIDVETGERDWKGGRYGFGQLLLADGYVLVLTEKGALTLVKATPEAHEEVASFDVLDGKTWNVPAYADGVLFVRNQTEMAAYRLAQ